MTDTIENPTIENPTADQLEAGGKVSGTYCGLPFTDWPLTAYRDWLTVGDDNQLDVREPNGRYCPAFTITSYTPPAVKPWWETCTGNTWVRWVDTDGEVFVLSAYRFRQLWVTEESRAARNPRRVSIADADTEVIGPKAVVDQLRASVGQYGEINSYTSESKQRKWGTALYCDAYALLAAVDERGER